jgi:hypothetical protein
MSIIRQRVRITNLPFHDVVGHNIGEREYFTLENNDRIYKRLYDETDITYMPVLGPSVDFGSGDICLEESIISNKKIYLFYIINRSKKNNLEEFSNIEDAVNRLVAFYVEMHLTKDRNKLLNIFYEELNLKRQKLIAIKAIS